MARDSGSSFHKARMHQRLDLNATPSVLPSGSPLYYASSPLSGLIQFVRVAFLRYLESRGNAVTRRVSISFCRIVCPCMYVGCALNFVWKHGNAHTLFYCNACSSTALAQNSVVALFPCDVCLFESVVLLFVISIYLFIF